MSHYERLLEQQDQLLKSLGPIVSDTDKRRAVWFAECHEDVLVSYNPAAAEWRTSDGETYSQTLINQEHERVQLCLSQTRFT